MYNNPLKIEFVETSWSNDSVKNRAYEVFKMTEPFEQKWESDLCTKNAHELYLMMQSILRGKRSSKEFIIAVLQEYCKWCVERGFPDARNGMTNLENLMNEKEKEPSPKKVIRSNNDSENLLVIHQNSFFNQEYKQRFSEEYSKSHSVQKRCYLLFASTKKYEEEWNADLCTKSVEELQPMIDEITALTKRSQQTCILLLQQYVKWCLNNNVPGACDGMLKITGTVNSKRMIYESVTSPRHLQTYLDSVFDPEDLHTIDNVRRTFCWLAFSGLLSKDIFNIKNKDINLDDMTIYYNGEIYPIYREGIKAIRNSVNLEVINIIHPLRTNATQEDRFDSDLVMRGIRNVLTFKDMTEIISRKQSIAIKKEKTNLRLGYFRIWLSGLFYRIYIDEIGGIPPDFIKEIDKIYAAKEAKIVNSAKNLHARYYAEDYKIWKQSLFKR